MPTKLGQKVLGKSNNFYLLESHESRAKIILVYIFIYIYRFYRKVAAISVVSTITQGILLTVFSDFVWIKLRNENEEISSSSASWMTLIAKTFVHAVVSCG